MTRTPNRPESTGRAALHVRVQADLVRGVHVLTISDAIVMENFLVIAEAIASLLDNEVARIELDLENQHDIRCAQMLGVLVAYERKARSLGGFLRITRPSPHVFSLLGIARLDERLLAPEAITA